MARQEWEIGRHGLSCKCLTLLPDQMIRASKGEKTTTGLPSVRDVLLGSSTSSVHTITPSEKHTAYVILRVFDCLATSARASNDIDNLLTWNDAVIS